jgi:hypothetical protein
LKRSLGLLIFFPFLTFIGCGGGSSSYVKKGEIQTTINQEAESSRYIQALGIGAADATLKNETQRRATSRDAAIVQAQYEMLSYVKGVQLEGGITVEKAMETDSKLESYLKEMIKSAEIVKSEWTNDDGCVVTMRLDKKKLTDAGLKLKS